MPWLRGGRASERWRDAGLCLAASLLGLGLAPRTASEGKRVVRPGTLVRWVASDIEACGAAAHRFEPIEGACVYPVDLLRRAGPMTLERWRIGRRETLRVEVARFDYPIQRLRLPRAYVELSPADAERVRRENRRTALLWHREGPRQFTLPLAPPLDPLPQEGRFGSRRIINGRKRSPHSGADYPAPEGAPVRSAEDGVVAMVAEHFFGGNSVFVDHGDGLITSYLHLSRVEVVEGQRVQRGGLLGRVGSTGRVTGPHLHFGVRWRGARIDPGLLLRALTELPALE